MCDWLRLSNAEGKNVCPFLLLENSRPPISTLRTPDPFFLLGDPGLLINLRRNWFSQVHEKMLNITNHQGNDKSKPQGDVTSHILEWLLLKIRNNKYFQGCGQRISNALFLGMWTSVSTMKNYIEVSQKIKNKFHTIKQFYFWVYVWKKWNHYLENIFVPPMFVAALFTTAQTWKQ